MSRCARCGWTRRRHWPYQAVDVGPACARFTPRDPWWIRLLAAIGKGRL